MLPARKIRRAAALCLCSVGGINGISAAHAQTSSPVLPAALKTITTDTGALAPGHRDYSRYNTPNLCAAAVRSEVQDARRTLIAQASARRTSVHDTLPSRAITVARMCVARFPVQKAAGRDLPTLFALALAAGEDSLADVVLGRRIATAPADSQRTQVLLGSLNAYLRAAPARVDAARALVARASKPGAAGADASGAARLWLDLQLTLLSFWASERPDAPERTQVADSILRFVRDNRAVGISTAQKHFLVSESYRALMSVAYLTHVESPDSALLAIARQAQADLGGNPAASQTQNTDTLRKIVRAFAPDGSVVVSDSERVSRSLGAQLWIPPGADTAAAAPGTVSLRYHLSPVCVTNYEAPSWNPICSAPLVQLQQWQQAYGSKLQLTMVASAQGHALYSGPQTPAEEAKTIAWYVRDYWHFPAAVALLPQMTMEEQRRQTTPYPFLEVIDDRGRVLYHGGMMEKDKPDNSAFLTTLIAHALP